MKSKTDSRTTSQKIAQRLPQEETMTIPQKAANPRNARLLTALAALLCLCLAQAGCSDQEQPASDTPQARYLPVTPERLVLTSELPGRVAALVTAEVRPQVDGIIQQRLFEEGAVVAKGQTLYQIDPAVYEAARNTAKAELEEAQVHAAAQQKREARIRVLARANAVSQQELDDVQAELGRARARVARARAALETAEINLDYTHIKAPVAGKIGRSSITRGALVTANQTSPLAVIQQIDHVYVDITQPSANMLRLRRLAASLGPAWGKGASGARLILEDGTPYAAPTAPNAPDVAGVVGAAGSVGAADTAGTPDVVNTPTARNTTGSQNAAVPGDTPNAGGAPDPAMTAEAEPHWITGDLLFAEISVAQSTGNVSLRALFPNPEGLLLPGMYARVLIEEGVIENALLVPQRAVMTDSEGRHFVMTLQGPQTPPQGRDAAPVFTVQRKNVALDRPHGNRWLVRSGLEAGDLVVIEGLQKAVPGGKAAGTLWQAEASAQADAQANAQPGADAQPKANTQDSHKNQGGR
ncbi:MAG: efflux RND transporter periplasmic adaptor subunit [Desulfovibrio sp.]|uniref:efflux RND transporter periplasmic adaptor subunit n=1 Tax=Desulfovibrio sp. TaxID=885 RepID=UPI002A36B3CD|nr:efflux RND transporter periplasmic adaptor subunit [Desulfovibrio sp.]MDY0259217.1 efflux RND transporter periplasmic adaptor subunit [Desulfovibrio sp.]